MNWLLDTHVWIWSQLAPERLGPDTVDLLSDTAQPLHLATISTLELARLSQGGQVVLTTTVDDFVRSTLLALAARTLELSHRIAAEAYSLPEPFHRDPADRVLVATARTHGLRIVTADQQILDYPHVARWDARR